jgi:hypothetical protein
VTRLVARNGVLWLKRPKGIEAATLVSELAKRVAKSAKIVSKSAKICFLLPQSKVI